MSQNRSKDNLLFETKLGKYFIDDSVKALSKHKNQLRNKVQLILTSPPFPLNKKKSYGNLTGNEYKKWFVNLAELFSELITDDGSIVIELGNSWIPKKPVQSLLQVESLLSFVKNKKAKLKLCQEFICYNPSRLPSPAQWVTINRIRTIDSFTRIWWMSKSDYPKADNKKVLRPYSKSMETLIEGKTYNSGKRPSEHKISEKGFLKNNGGSITHNVLEIEQIDHRRNIRLPHNMFSIANTQSNDYFMRTCKAQSIIPHPARMPLELASFFIQFLTDEGDIVLDPFAGSNTTGFCAEKEKRQWIAYERFDKYGEQAIVRFQDPILKSKMKTETLGE